MSQYTNYEIGYLNNNKIIYKTTIKIDYVKPGMTKEEMEEFQRNNNPPKNGILNNDKKSSIYFY